MRSIKARAVALTLVVFGGAGVRVAHATPTDSYFPWSWGSLRLGDLVQGSDNDTYVRFRDPNGAVRKYWPNSAGTDICGGSDTLRLSRARVNYKEILDTLGLSTSSGRTLWVAYEPVNGVCYIKSVAMTVP